MQRNWLTDDEVRLASERSLKFQGTAKVKIDQIEFCPPLPRDLDSKKLESLREVFLGKLDRLNANNHVPATISQRSLTDALQRARISPANLLDSDSFPRLQFPTERLRGLHGRHRIQVGSELLAPIDRWWTVDIYLSEDLKTNLVEEYADQRQPSDGEIYRKIRQYEGEGNESFRQRWRARLTPNKRDRLDQLDRHENRLLRKGFDDLLAIPGLWYEGMRIGMIHTLVAIDCVEEILNYLGRVKVFWSSLVQGDPVAMRGIDQDTVHSLQLMAPGNVTSDAKAVQGLVLSGEVFEDLDYAERVTIWTRIKNFDGMIPSLFTFFEDFKYLQSCAHCVKRLFGSCEGSIRNTLRHMFNGEPDTEEECLIQISERKFRTVRVTSLDRFELGYRQIWLAAQRDYPLMPQDAKNKDELLAKANHAEIDEGAVYRLADLAHRMGFSSPEIDGLRVSPDRLMAKAVLLKARKPDQFSYNEEEFDQLVDRIVECFQAARPHERNESCELLAYSAVKLRNRCGMPRTGAHNQDRDLLFLDRIYDVVPVTNKITTFFIRRCVYFAFFGSFPVPTIIGQSFRSPSSDQDTAMFFSEGGGPSRRRNDSQRRRQSTILLRRPRRPRRPRRRQTRIGQRQSSAAQHSRAEETIEEEMEDLGDISEEESAELPHDDPPEKDANDGEMAENEPLDEGTNVEDSTHQAQDEHSELYTGEEEPVEYDLHGSDAQEMMHQQNNLPQSPSDRNTALETTAPEPSMQNMAETGEPVDEGIVQIDFVYAGEVPVLAKSVQVNYSDHSEIELVARDYRSKNFLLQDQDSRGLAPEDCFKAATSDGKNVILLVPETDEAGRDKNMQSSPGKGLEINMSMDNRLLEQRRGPIRPRHDSRRQIQGVQRRFDPSSTYPRKRDRQAMESAIEDMVGEPVEVGLEPDRPVVDTVADAELLRRMDAIRAEQERVEEDWKESVWIKNELHGNRTNLMHGKKPLPELKSSFDMSSEIIKLRKIRIWRTEDGS